MSKNMIRFEKNREDVRKMEMRFEEKDLKGICSVTDSTKYGFI